MHGQPASWCRECRKRGKATTGKFQCSQESGICLYPVPKLSLEDQLILQLMNILDDQWRRVGTFSYDRRTGIPFSDVAVAAQLIGLKLNARRLKKIKACVRAIVNDDIQAINESQPQGK
jgi:hypothetical protein